MNLRLATWNLEGRWGAEHRALMADLAIDVWLLTEAPKLVDLPDYSFHGSAASMAPGRHWAGLLVRDSLDMTPWRDDPHPASAAADLLGVTFCSSVLPWRSCGGELPWQGTTTADRTGAAVAALISRLPRGATIWGGDWNHALTGSERAGSLAGRSHITAAVKGLGLWVPTTPLPHRIDGLSTIDHIAVPNDVDVLGAERLLMTGTRGHLSDHDAYLVEVALA